MSAFRQYTSRTQKERNEKPGLLLVAAAPPRLASAINHPPSVLSREDKNNNSPLVLTGGAKHDRSSTTRSQEGGGSHKRARAYDWAASIKAAKHRLSCAEVEELAISEVGRVVEGGRTTNLYNVDKSGIQQFIAYDRSHVYARVPHLYMKDTLIEQAAALHIGGLHGCAHPDDLELETNWQRLEDGNWAIHIHPKAGTGPKKARS